MILTDHLVKVMSAGCLQHEVAILAFVIDVFLVRMRLCKVFETMKISCFLAHSSPLILVIAFDSFLEHYYNIDVIYTYIEN